MILVYIILGLVAFLLSIKAVIAFFALVGCIAEGIEQYKWKRKMDDYRKNNESKS